MQKEREGGQVRDGWTAHPVYNTSGWLGDASERPCAGRRYGRRSDRLGGNTADSAMRDSRRIKSPTPVIPGSTSPGERCTTGMDPEEDAHASLLQVWFVLSENM